MKLSLLLLLLSFVCLVVPGAEPLAGICFIVGLIGLFASQRKEQA
jgi:hypothetical protein